MSELALSSAPQSIGVVAAGLAAAFTSTVQKLRAHRSARQAVQQLSQLDDRMLKDIGLTRSEVAGVLDGPLYRDPSVLLARSAEWRRRGRPVVTASTAQSAPVRRVVPAFRGDFQTSLRAGR